LPQTIAVWDGHFKPLLTDMDHLADQLARIEAKLDTILERLRWSPESCADWYQSQAQQAQAEDVLPLFKK